MKSKDGRECPHDERYDDECDICVEAEATEAAYWLAYFGGPEGIKRKAAQERFGRQEYDGRTYEEHSREEQHEINRREKGHP